MTEFQMNALQSQLLDELNVGIVTYDCVTEYDFHVIYANKYMMDLFDSKDHPYMDFSGEELLHLVHPQDLPVMLEFISALLKGDEEVPDCIFRMRMGKKGWRYHSCKGSSMKQENGHVICHAVYTDVDEEYERSREHDLMASRLLYSNPNVRCGFALNLTKNTVIENMGMSEYTEGLMDAKDADTLLANIRNIIVDQENADQIRALFYRSSLIQKYNDKDRQFSVVYERKTEGDQLIYVKTFVELMRNPSTKDIEVVAYTINYEHQHMGDEVFRVMTMEDYTVIGTIDTDTHIVHFFSNENGIKENVPGADVPTFEKGVEEVMANLSPNENRQYLEQRMTVENICHELDENGSCSITYTSSGITAEIRYKYMDELKTRILFLGRDITQLVQDRHQIEVQKTLLDCTQILHDEEDSHTALNRLMETIGKFYGADRAYIFEMDYPHDECSNTYEWCEEGVRSEINNLQNIPLESIGRWLDLYENAENVYISSLSTEIDRDSLEYQVLSQQNIESLMTTPLREEGKIIGFIGVDNPKRRIEDMTLLESIGAFVTTEIEKRMNLDQKMLAAAAKTYVAMYYYDFSTDHYREISSTSMLRGYFGKEGDDLHTLLNSHLKLGLYDEYREAVFGFVNLETLQTRLLDKDVISIDFPTEKLGWLRTVFIVVHRDEKGIADQVILAAQDINEDKEREITMSFKAEHDALTGAMNRNAMERIVERFRSGSRLAFLIMDIDLFKEINDTYGHDTGDEVLKRAADLLHDTFRSSDFVVRLGGDEFAVLLPGFTEDHYEIAKRKMNLINAKMKTAVNGLPAAALSSGIAFSTDGYSEQLYKNADEALYQSKENRSGICTKSDKTIEGQED